MTSPSADLNQPLSFPWSITCVKPCFLLSDKRKMQTTLQAHLIGSRFKPELPGPHLVVQYLAELCVVECKVRNIPSKRTAAIAIAIVIAIVAVAVVIVVAFDVGVNKLAAVMMTIKEASEMSP